jgi:hypothetical protein
MAASAVSFNGTNTRYTRTALGLGGSFTMACWVKIVVDQNTYTSVLAQGDGASNYYHLGTGSTGTLFTRDSTSGAGANSGYDFPIGTWVYIATVNDTGAGNDLMGYKPAGGSWTPLALGAATVTGPSDTNTFYIGADSFGGWLNGSVAAVKIWHSPTLSYRPRPPPTHRSRHPGCGRRTRSRTARRPTTRAVTVGR